MSNVFRRIHLDLTGVGFVSAIADFQGVERKKQPGLPDRNEDSDTVTYTHFSKVKVGRKGSGRGRCYFKVNGIGSSWHGLVSFRRFSVQCSGGDAGNQVQVPLI